MTLQITHQDRTIKVLGHFVFLGGEEGMAASDSVEIRFEGNGQGRIRRTLAFLDSPRYILESEETPMGELRLDSPVDPDGRITFRDDSFSIATSGSCTLLRKGDTHIARLTPAWRDSQLKQGVLAEISLHGVCDDWVLAAFAFAWLSGQASAKRDSAVFASLMLFPMLG